MLNRDTHRSSFTYNVSTKHSTHYLILIYLLAFAKLYKQDIINFKAVNFWQFIFLDAIFMKTCANDGAAAAAVTVVAAAAVCNLQFQVAMKLLCALKSSNFPNYYQTRNANMHGRSRPRPYLYL